MIKIVNSGKSMLPAWSTKFMIAILQKDSNTFYNGGSW